MAFPRVKDSFCQQLGHSMNQSPFKQNGFFFGCAPLDILPYDLEQFKSSWLLTSVSEVPRWLACSKMNHWLTHFFQDGLAGFWLLYLFEVDTGTNGPVLSGMFVSPPACRVEMGKDGNVGFTGQKAWWYGSWTRERAVRAHVWLRLQQIQCFRNALQTLPPKKTFAHVGSLLAHALAVWLYSGTHWIGYWPNWWADVIRAANAMKTHWQQLHPPCFLTNWCSSIFSASSSPSPFPKLVHLNDLNALCDHQISLLFT